LGAKSGPTILAWIGGYDYVLKAVIEQKESASYYPYYEHLYIYLLKGMVTDDDETAFDNGYIGNWVEGETSFLFFSRPARDEVMRLLHTRSDLYLIDDYRFTYEEWQGGVWDALRVDPFLIIPPGIKKKQGDGLFRIILDPGVVFGNGLHPTTRDCLRALACAARRLPLACVLDLGTGTGILALAAARIGAKRVLAVDLNPLCVKTAIRNVNLNSLDGIVQIVEGRAEDVANEPADLVVANIPYNVIVTLLDNGCFRDKERLILSGLMRSQARDIKVRLARYGMTVKQEWEDTMTWYTVLVWNEMIRAL
jgi:ribosomal protein L11 methyltransferase